MYDVLMCIDKNVFNICQVYTLHIGVLKARGYSLNFSLWMTLLFTPLPLRYYEGGRVSFYTSKNPQFYALFSKFPLYPMTWKENQLFSMRGLGKLATLYLSLFLLGSRVFFLLSAGILFLDNGESHMKIFVVDEKP